MRFGATPPVAVQQQPKALPCDRTIILIVHPLCGGRGPGGAPECRNALLVGASSLRRLIDTRGAASRARADACADARRDSARVRVAKRKHSPRRQPGRQPGRSFSYSTLTKRTRKGRHLFAVFRGIFLFTNNFWGSVTSLSLNIYP